jgi:arylsulfatase A-like enzyme
LIIKAPGQHIGQITDQPAISMDLYPTVIQLAGLSLLPEQHQDGQSLVPVLEQPDRVDERPLVWHYPHYHGTTWKPGSAIRQGDWKLVEFYEEDTVELYNLADDEGEKLNLSAEKPDKAAKLQVMMHEYIQSRGGKFPVKKEGETMLETK